MKQIPFVSIRLGRCFSNLKKKKKKKKENLSYDASVEIQNIELCVCQEILTNKTKHKNLHDCTWNGPTFTGKRREEFTTS